MNLGPVLGGLLCLGVCWLGVCFIESDFVLLDLLGVVLLLAGGCGAIFFYGIVLIQWLEIGRQGFNEIKSQVSNSDSFKELRKRRQETKEIQELERKVKRKQLLDQLKNQEQ